MQLVDDVDTDAAVLEPVAPTEVYRRWLRMIRLRLERSACDDLAAPPAPEAYRSGAELEVIFTYMDERFIATIDPDTLHVFDSGFSPSARIAWLRRLT